MIFRLGSWLRRRSKDPQAFTAPLPRPERPVCIIGDVHGRADLLEDLLGQIAAQPRYPEARLIAVGDLIDRGPDSPAVIERMMALTADPRAICLMGNHERMMLDFLDDPAASTRWLNHGAETCLLYTSPSPRD